MCLSLIRKGLNCSVFLLVGLWSRPIKLNDHTVSFFYLKLKVIICYIKCLNKCSALQIMWALIPFLFDCQEAGLREGDYIVAVDGQDCKWAKHGEVVHMLTGCSDREVEIRVVTLHSHDTQVNVTIMCA